MKIIAFEYIRFFFYIYYISLQYKINTVSTSSIIFQHYLVVPCNNQLEDTYNT